MPIRLKTRVILWGRWGGRCSFPGCNTDLAMDGTATDDPALIGDAAHIVAESDHGPRADPTVPVSQRDEYDNLILLCKNHHKTVDDQPNHYTADVLRGFKVKHEASVRAALDQRQLAFLRANEVYATYVEEWAERADLDKWKGWSGGFLFDDQPSLTIERDRSLSELGEWLLGRV